MAGLIQGAATPLLTATVYWQGAAVIFHGFLAGTDCSVIMWPDQRAAIIVPTSALTTTAAG